MSPTDEHMLYIILVIAIRKWIHYFNISTELLTHWWYKWTLYCGWWICHNLFSTISSVNHSNRLCALFVVFFKFFGLPLQLFVLLFFCHFWEVSCSSLAFPTILFLLSRFPRHFRFCCCCFCCCFCCGCCCYCCCFWWCWISIIVFLVNTVLKVQFVSYSFNHMI